MAGKTRKQKKSKFLVKEKNNQQAQAKVSQRVKKNKEKADQKAKEFAEVPANVDIGDVREPEPETDLVVGIVANALAAKSAAEPEEKEIPMETMEESVKRLEAETKPFDPMSVVNKMLDKE